MTNRTLRPRFASFAMHFWTGTFLLASTLIGLVTKSFSNNILLIPPIGLGAWLMISFASGMVRSGVEVGPNHLTITNPFSRPLTIEVDSIGHLEIKDRWWTYLAYGAIGGFQLSSPTAYLVTKEGSTCRVVVSAPVTRSSDSWQVLGIWCASHDIRVEWK